MYVTCEQCETHRGEFKEDLREVKAESKKTDDMLTEEIRGLRYDINNANKTTNELMLKLTELIVKRETDKENNEKAESRIKWVIGVGLTVIGILVSAGLFLK